METETLEVQRKILISELHVGGRIFVYINLLSALA